LLLVQAVRSAERGELSSLALVPLLTYLGTSLVNVNEVVLDWMFWLSAGLIASGGAVPLLAARSSRRSEPQARTWLGAVLLVAALAVIAFGEVPRLVAGEAMLASEAYAAANRGATALTFGERAVTADPRRAENWSAYGTALFSAGRYPAAVSAYEAAATLQPWQGQSWRNLAITWGALANPRATLAAAQRAVAVDPYDSVSHALLSSILYDQGDWARAATEGERAITLTAAPTSGTYFVTISAYVQLRQLEPAEALSRTAVAAFPTKPLRFQLASILADRGKKDEALAVCDALLAQFPGDVDTLVLRSSILSKP
jgi:tetratricopeptide (TPR) repeat protein